MYANNLLLGSRNGKSQDDKDRLLEKKDGEKKVDMVTVFVPELTSDNQVYCKSVTSIMDSQDYQSYLPVYRPLSLPLPHEGRRMKTDTKCTWTALILLLAFIVICLLVASAIFAYKFL